MNSFQEHTLFLLCICISYKHFFTGHEHPFSGMHQVIDAFINEKGKENVFYDNPSILRAAIALQSSTTLTGIN